MRSTPFLSGAICTPEPPTTSESDPHPKRASEYIIRSLLRQSLVGHFSCPCFHLRHHPGHYRGSYRTCRSRLRHGNIVVDINRWGYLRRWNPVITLQGVTIPPPIATIMWSRRGSECFISHDKVRLRPIQARSTEIEFVIISICGCQGGGHQSSRGNITQAQQLCWGVNRTVVVFSKYLPCREAPSQSFRVGKELTRCQ